MKQKYALALATVLPLAATLSLSTIAQDHKTMLPTQKREHVLVSTHNDSNNNTETLSGIHLYPTGKGTYGLDFSQKLDENAVLSISNSSKKVVFQRPVRIAEGDSTWHYKLGKLKPDTYQIEVKTSDTTYWTKFKVGR